MSGGEAEVAHLYDWLSLHVQALRLLGSGSRVADGTMHKALALEPGDLASSPTQLVNDLARTAVALPDEPCVLDAGCGFGGTIFRWLDACGGRYDGMTASRVQWIAARREAARRGVAGRCRFHLQSYDRPPPGRYDVIVAIESLMPSRDLAATLRNLAAALRGGGHLILVEDALAAGAVPGPDGAVLAEMWSCARVRGEPEYRDAIARAGLTLVVDRDLTDRVRPRDEPTLRPIERRCRSLHDAIPIAGVRAILRAYLGGVALERLYRSGTMRYVLLAAQK
jgi:SAM-dependent methyltransferase